MKGIEKILIHRSIRKFKNEPVSKEVMNNILEAGRRSPSAINAQPWHFVIARDQKAKEACSLGTYNSYTRDASFVVVGLHKPSEAIIEAYFDGFNDSPSKHGGCSLGSRSGDMLDGRF